MARQVTHLSSPSGTGRLLLCGAIEEHPSLTTDSPEKVTCPACLEGLKQEPPHDPVDHPEHYMSGGIETLDFIKAKLTPEEYQGYCIGNVLKYLSRWRHKGGVEDLKKARFYLGRAITSVEEEQYA